LKKPKSAFDSNHTYRDYVEEGKRIGTERNQQEISHHLANMLVGEQIEAQRSSAITQHCSDVDVTLYQQHIAEMLSILENPVHPACPRAIFRIFERLEVPEKHLGKLIDLSFKYLSDSNSAIASIVFSLGTISKHLRKYPDLTNELKLILQDMYPRASAGVKSKIRAVVKKHKLEDVI
jgi:hypothetical protein